MRSDLKQRAGDAKGGTRYALIALAMAVGSLSACEGVLEVELPGEIDGASVFQPAQASILVASAIGDMECGISDFIAGQGGGGDDALVRITGWWGQAHEYATTTTTGNCHTSETALGWWAPMQKGRWLAEQTYQYLTEWTDAQVTGRERLLAQSAIYASIFYGYFGELFCEVSVDVGELMSPDQTLAKGEEYLTSALAHIQSTGDFAIPGGVTTSARQMAYLLRARIRIARGNESGAAADAAQVEPGYFAYITRESGGALTRTNRVVTSHNEAAWNSIAAAIDHWEGPPNPVTGQAWPAVIPFTGYRNLGILPDGRAISNSQHPITTTANAGAVPDTRVPVVDVGTTVNNYAVWRQQKYTGRADDMPLANWEEAWLILAQVEGGQGAIDRVNRIRQAHNLPLVTYLSPADQDGIRHMIIEELRRSLFLEGRFWSYKIRNTDLLWFPRGVGRTAYPYNYQAGIRLAMPAAEFDLNPNLTEDMRNTLCHPNERPII